MKRITVKSRTSEPDRFPKSDKGKQVHLEISSKSTQIYFLKLLLVMNITTFAAIVSWVENKFPFCRKTDITAKIIFCDLTK